MTNHISFKLFSGSLVLLALIWMFPGCNSDQNRQQNGAAYDSLEIQKQNPELKENHAAAVLFHPHDSMIVMTILKNSMKEGLKEKPINEIVMDVAKEFLGTVYVGHTLERDGDEMLIVNLRGLDCTTYLENVVVISSLIKQERTSFEDYTQKLTQIRYREGILNMYPSRLHYFSDWLYDNEKKGIIDDLTKELGGKEYNKEIFFITRNRDKYEQLSKDEYVSAIKKTEQELSSRQLYYIPEDELEGIEDKIQDGDLIAITSAVDGIDIAHVAFAIHKNNRLHIIHASSASEKVVISKEPLSEYLEKNRSQSGIMLGRLSEF